MLMDGVSNLMWTGGKHAVLWRQHAVLWRQHAEFLRTADGAAYAEALIHELDVFRETLRQWEAEARVALASGVERGTITSS